MDPAQNHALVPLVPAAPLRAALLSFVAALACLETGAGVVLVEATRQAQTGAAGGTVVQLQEMLARVRAVEGVVVTGAVVLAVLWSGMTVYNASLAARRPRVVVTSAVAAGAALATVPAGMWVAASRPELAPAMGVAVPCVLVLAAFGVLGHAGRAVGASRAAVAQCAAASVVAVGAVQGTGLLGGDTQDLGRAALVALLNGLVLGLVAATARDATRELHSAIEERAWYQSRVWAAATARFRAPAHLVTAVHPGLPGAP